MNDLIWLSDKQLERIKPCFPKSHDITRVDVNSRHRVEHEQDNYPIKALKNIAQRGLPFHG